VGDAAAAPAARLNGFLPALTSFVGRAGQVSELAGLLAEYRLVTVTGPGGVGKTRLAGEVAGRVADRFADGVWLVELAAVQEPALVPAAVAIALGRHQLPGMSMTRSLAEMLARQQLLLVLDNCEHVAAALAQLCGALLPIADDVRVLATSREPIGVAGEARYRVPPLGLPGPDGDGARGTPEAVALFADRARQADTHFSLSGAAGPLVERLVTRLDGMPLAIELAAARVEALGLSQLLNRLDDRFRLLVSTDRTAAARQRSLVATVDWSYQLLGAAEQEAFRRLALFPAPFTLDAAEAVVGPAAAQAVVHLVECSLLTTPQTGPDGRARYAMLETLRAYGLDRLAEAGEQPAAAAALAAYALRIAEQAATSLQTSAGELEGARWLDTEDATTHQALTWALGQDGTTAARLATALAPWWQLRGRMAAGYALLRAAAERTAPGSEIWCAAQIWLGQAAKSVDFAASLGHYTAAHDALAAGGPSRLLADCLGGRSGTLINLSRIAEGSADAERALALARETGYPAGEARALVNLSYAAYHEDDTEQAVRWARQAQQIDPSVIPGWLARLCCYILAPVLAVSGELAAARRSCVDGLAHARQAGDVDRQMELLILVADLEQRAGDGAEAGAHLREAAELAISTRTDRMFLCDILDCWGHVCAQTGRSAEALTLWAARAAHVSEDWPDQPQEAQRRREQARKAAQALGPARARAAEERGAAMTTETATELALMITDPRSPAPQPTPGSPAQEPLPGPSASQPAQGRPVPQQPRDEMRLSARERELVILVAQGRTDAQIAAQLYISVTTVRSHLERIRDKSGSRRRADLTRLALQAGLV
jgi:predicted ATPase/DNA-binding CsgD family transcriptional regulator